MPISQNKVLNDFSNLDEIMEDWVKSAGHTISIIKDVKQKTLFLYAEQPNYIYGYRNRLFRKYKKYVKKLGWKKIQIVKLDRIYLCESDSYLPF